MRKAEFLQKVQEMIQSKMTPVGVGIQQFGFIGAPRVPEVIAQSITAKARAIPGGGARTQRVGDDAGRGSKEDRGGGR